MSSSAANDLLISNSQRETEINKAKLSFIKNDEKIKKFLSVREELKNKYKVVEKAECIIARFAADLSRTAFIDMQSYELDTHSNHPNTHKNKLTDVFSQFASLLKKFEDYSVDGKNSLLSQTTFMVASEFTRTPALNASQGKDHNPQANSFVVMSPGIKPGITGNTHLVTRGESRMGIPYLAATPVDKETEQAVFRRENAMILRPENVMSTVLTSMGIDPAVFGSSLSFCSETKNYTQVEK